MGAMKLQHVPSQGPVQPPRGPAAAAERKSHGISHLHTQNKHTHTYTHLVRQARAHIDARGAAAPELLDQLVVHVVPVDLYVLYSGCTVVMSCLLLLQLWLARVLINWHQGCCCCCCKQLGLPPCKTLVQPLPPPPHLERQQQLEALCLGDVPLMLGQQAVVARAQHVKGVRDELDLLCVGGEGRGVCI